MKSDVWIGKKGFRYYYYHFRDSEYYSLTIIGLIILVCLILVFNIVIPEVTQWFSIRDEVAATQQQISFLQQNINFINNMDKGILNSQLQTASHALPPEKNFGSMLSALSNAAASSNVSLNDYSFQVGNVASAKSEAGDIQRKGLSAIEITVIVNGSIDNIRRFIQALNANLPLSEVTSVNGTGENVAIRLQFYQKPFTNVAVSNNTPLTGLSTKKAELLQTIAKWDNTAEQNLPVQSSSSSGVPLF